MNDIERFDFWNKELDQFLAELEETKTEELKTEQV